MAILLSACHAGAFFSCLGPMLNNCVFINNQAALKNNLVFTICVREKTLYRFYYCFAYYVYITCTLIDSGTKFRSRIIHLRRRSFVASFFFCSTPHTALTTKLSPYTTTVLLSKVERYEESTSLYFNPDARRRIFRPFTTDVQFSDTTRVRRVGHPTKLSSSSYVFFFPK